MTSIIDQINAKLIRPRHVQEDWTRLTMKINYSEQSAYFDFLKLRVGPTKHFYAQGFAAEHDDRNGRVIRPFEFYYVSAYFARPEDAFECKLRFAR